MMRARATMQHDDERSGPHPAGEQPNGIDLNEHESRS
jgi:hypothetical protein